MRYALLLLVALAATACTTLTEPPISPPCALGYIRSSNPTGPSCVPLR